MKSKGIIKELRLDNYITCDQHYGAIKVDAIHKKKIGFHRNPGRLEWIYAYNIHSIPITREFLERNFVPLIANFYSATPVETFDEPLYGVIEYKLPNTAWPLVLYMDGSVGIEGHTLVRCKSVHQLQNLLADCGIDIVLKVKNLTVNEEKTE